MKFEVVAATRARAVWLRPEYIAMAAAVVVTLLCWPRLFPIDDAYITLSNARTLMSGTADPVYGSSYLTGATSPAHLLAVAALGFLVPPIWALLLIGLVGAVFYLLGLMRLVERAGLDGWRAAALVGVGSLSGYLPFQYVNGLETSVAMAFSAWMLIWCNDRKRLPVLAGIAPFVRPEFALFSALLLGRQLYLSRDIRPLLVAAVVAAPWAVWMVIETGQPLPSTIGAKLAFFREYAMTWPAKLVRAEEALAWSLQWPLFLGLVGLPRIKGGKMAAIFIVLGVCVAIALMPSSLNWNYGRYDAFFVPLLVAGLAALVAERSRAANLIATGMAVWTATGLVAIPEYLGEIAYARQVEDHARFVAKLPPEAKVLIHDAGWVAWEQPKARLVDVVGLKTPAVIPINRQLGGGQCNDGKALDEIARRFHATHAVVLNRWQWPCMAEDLRALGWTLKPIYSDLYTVYRLEK